MRRPLIDRVACCAPARPPARRTCSASCATARRRRLRGARRRRWRWSCATGPLAGCQLGNPWRACLLRKSLSWRSHPTTLTRRLPGIAGAPTWSASCPRPRRQRRRSRRRRQRRPPPASTSGWRWRCGRRRSARRRLTLWPWTRSSTPRWAACVGCVGGRLSVSQQLGLKLAQLGSISGVDVLDPNTLQSRPSAPAAVLLPLWSRRCRSWWTGWWRRTTRWQTT